MRRFLLWTILLTVVFELAAIALRFGVGFDSTRDTAILSRFTFGLRIHHGYLGLVVILATWLAPRKLSRWKIPLLAVGLSLAISDLIHHFLILWPITGSPQFDLIYP